MSVHYRSKDGDNLDWICWRYYIQEVGLGAATMAVDPRLLISAATLENSFLFNPQTDIRLRGIVEKVLDANPGLAAWPLALPAGLSIVLPDLTQQLIESDSVKLWD